MTIGVGPDFRAGTRTGVGYVKDGKIDQFWAGGSRMLKAVPGKSPVIRHVPEVSVTNNATTPPPIRIQLADEGYLIRLGLEQTVAVHDYLQLDAVTDNGADAVVAAAASAPDVVLLDPDLRNCGGLEATQQIRSSCPTTKVAMLAASADPESIHTAISAGACSYLTKNSLTEDLGPALRMIHRGGSVFAGPMPWNGARKQDYSAKAVERTKILRTLSERDKAILEQTTEGLSNGAVARQLHLSEATVKGQLTQMMTRLRVSNRVQLSVLAVRAGILES